MLDLFARLFELRLQRGAGGNRLGVGHLLDIGEDGLGLLVELHGW